MPSYAYPTTNTNNVYDIDFGISTNGLASIGVWAIIAMVLAIVGGILVYFLFVKKNLTIKNKFLAWLKKFLAFKIMWIESILQILYYISTIFAILVSFAFIPYDFGTFLACLIIWPILLRVAYEAILVMLKIWENTRETAANTREMAAALTGKKATDKASDKK